MSRNFQRRIEEFECEHCGYQVQGSGYTNHCPLCLWSKHVDVQPGDREEKCQGMMEPIGVEVKKSKYRILHHCTRCGLERWNKAAKEDDFEAILQLSAEQWGQSE